MKRLLWLAFGIGVFLAIFTRRAGDPYEERLAARARARNLPY
jgi:hypothetical protein